MLRDLIGVVLFGAMFSSCSRGQRRVGLVRPILAPPVGARAEGAVLCPRSVRRADRHLARAAGVDHQHRANGRRSCTRAASASARSIGDERRPVALSHASTLGRRPGARLALAAARAR
jgi:hypothetical protein